MTTLHILPSDELDPKPNSAFIAITPEMAARWLKFNVKNRNIRRQDVDRYKRDMIADNWHLDGSPIRFAKDGALLDGQHRLTAIVESGKTVTMLVVRGISADAQSVMDTGRRRTASDALAINGHKHSSTVAAAALLALSVEAGQVDGRYEASHEEILNFIDANPGVEESAEAVKAYCRKSDCPPSIVTYTHWVLSGLSPAMATDFWRSASEKVGLGEGDPIIALTNRFAESRRNRERLPKRAYLSLIYRAWNARRAGKTMRTIRVNSAAGGLIPIPEPK